MGRSPGGFGTKIHGIIDALGNPVGFTLTGAEQADVGQASALLAMAADAQAVIAPRQARDTADKGYDSAALVQQIEANSAEAIIPPRSNRSSPQPQQ